MKSSQMGMLALVAMLSVPLTTAAGPLDPGVHTQRAPDAVFDHGDADYARVIRVDPVSDHAGHGVAGEPRPRCYTRSESYGSNGYPSGGYGGDGYGTYRDQGRYPGTGNGTAAGRAMATVVGGVLGAVVGSQMGNGSGRYVASSVGSMVGGIAGQQVYENAVRQRSRQAEVTVCDPVPAGVPHPYPGQPLYDITYEYGGRHYVERTSHAYRPGDRIRVRVDVRPE